MQQSNKSAPPQVVGGATSKEDLLTFGAGLPASRPPRQPAPPPRPAAASGGRYYSFPV